VIRYALACGEGHAFEGWFGGSNAFDEQRAAGGISCPVCGSADVDKALMAPAVAGTKRAAGGGEAPIPVAAPHALPEELVTMLRKLRRHVTENADYVGDRFAEEARRIHYEEAEARGIYGEATREEAVALSEEGIEFHPLPVLPEDRN
jgi:hypothetical protein